MDDDRPRALGLDWSDEEIVEALSDELAHYLAEADVGVQSEAENAVIERAFREMGEDDDSTKAWLCEDANRKRVLAAARSKAGESAS